MKSVISWSRYLQSRALPLAMFIFLVYLIENAQPVNQRKRIQYFDNEPRDKSVILGDDVIMPCRIVNVVGSVQWTKDDFALGVDRQLTGYERYKMVGSDEEGDYSLLISDVNLEDDAHYQCQAGFTEKVEGIASKKAKLTVFTPPNPPVITEGKKLKTVEGKKVQLSCKADGGKPAAELHWLDGDGYEIREGTQRLITPIDDTKKWKSELKLNVKATHEYHNTTLTCRSENPALKSPQIAKIKIEVKFSPVVQLTVNNRKIKEFDSVKFMCQFEANPNDVTFKWYKNGVPIIGNYDSSYVLRSVSRKDNGVAISCEVTNSVGSSISSFIIDVYYRPIIEKKTTYITADERSNVTLKCPVDSNPRPLIVWKHEDKNFIVEGSKETLVIINVNNLKKGKYSCTATVPGFSSSSQDFLVLLKGPPKIKSPDIQIGVVGHTIKLECLIYSVPLPDDIVWSKNSKVIDTYTSSKYTLEQNTLADGVNNILVIHRVTDEDFGRYNCSVKNLYGADHLEILLRQNEQPSLVIIIAGIVGGVVLVIAISIIVILVLKHRKDKRKKKLNVDMKHELPSGCKVQKNDAEPKVINDSFRNSTLIREPQDLNGYVPYSDYVRDYAPPPIQLNNLRDEAMYDIGDDNLPKIDPRYSAGYANPYLSRNSISQLPPPHTFNSMYRTIPSTSTSPSSNAGGVNIVNALSKKQHIIAPENSSNVEINSPTTHV
ncbi:KIRREL (predicted) [Pycnogonum litorale]